MKHVKTKMLGLLVVVLLVGVGGCKKAYKCYSQNSQYVVCGNGNDTIRYFTEGIKAQEIMTKAYYEGKGYTCTAITGYMVGNSGTSPLLPKEDAKYLESQGYHCVESRY